MRKHLFRVLPIVVLLLVGLLIPVGISAISNPTSVTIGSIAVFPDLWETGDQLFFMEYDVNYAADPLEDAEYTWQMAVYNTAGTAPVAGGVKALNYYQHNIISRYFSADTALTWGDPYYVKVMGNPAYFSPLIEGTNMKTWVLTTSAYLDADDALTYFTSMAETLETDWGVTLLGDLNRLNTTGSTYFLLAVPGLDTAVPDLFERTLTTPVAMGVNYTGVAAEAARKAKQGARLTTALTEAGSYFGISEGWAGTLFLWVFIVVFGGIVYASTRNPQMALFFIIPVAVTLAGIGLGTNVLLAIALGVFVLGILFALMWLLARLG